MPLSPAQHRMCRLLEGLVRVWFREPTLFAERAQLKLEALLHQSCLLARSRLGACMAPPARSGAHAFVASRACFMKQEAHFDPTPFLSTFEAVAYVEPRTLDRPEPRPTSALRLSPVTNAEMLEYARS